MKTSRRAALLTAVAVAALAVASSANEGVTVTTSKVKDLSLRIYGFVEADAIADTTEGFTEEQDNNLVPMRTLATNPNTGLQKNSATGDAPGVNIDNFAGQHHRSEGSIRNSRLGFDLTLPKTESGLASEAVFELDFLGNNAPNTAPGSAPGSQTERDFYNNPAVRVRHAYLNLTYKDSLNAKFGQYWSLLGWQPYYFPGETIVMPAVGQLYRRFAQARVTHTLNVADAWTLESAADAAKPAEMNSGNPELHGGFRVASTKYKAASIGGAGTTMVGLSAGVSGALIPIQTNGIGNPTGSAVAVDVAVPLIPSTDGKDRGNNLIWMGEFMNGSGVGGLEMAGLTFGVPGISATTANAGSAVDSGIAGVNADGNAELIHARSFRSHLQYCLPGGKWAVSGGYAQVEARNLDRFSWDNAKNANNFYAFTPKLQYGYVSLFWDAAGWLRFAAEANQTRDTYNDPNNRFATNNRYQLSAFFVF